MISPLLRETVGKGGGKGVAPLVVGVTVVTAYPDEIHLVDGKEIQKCLPQVGVEGRGFVTFFPAAGAPALCPSLGDGIDHVFGIGVEGDLAGLFEGLQRLDGGGQLHAVVGGFPLASAHFLFVLTVDENCAPAALSGISAACAVCIYINVSHVLFPFGDAPFFYYSIIKL